MNEEYLDEFDMEMSEEDKIAYDKAMDEYIAAEKLAYEKDQKVLELVKSKISKTAYEDVLYEIEVSENTWNYLITDEPKGRYQEDTEFEELGGLWVDQTTNGGYLGDEYAGTVSIKISDDEFFQFEYSM